MTGFVALWSHLLAAALYGALAVYQLRRWQGDPLSRPLVTAFAAMSVWTIFLALLGPYTYLAQLAESGRNLAFLAFMYGLLEGAEDRRGERSVKWLFGAVAGIVGLQIVVGGVMPDFDRAPLIFEALASASQLIGLLIAAGSLILVHNLYGQAAPGSRRTLSLSMLGLAGMWAYDLHLYTVAFFARTPALELFALRGIVLSALAALFTMGARNATWRIQISRAATFQSVSLIAILVYLIAMMLAARAMEIVGGDWARVGQVGVVFVTTLVILVLLPSAKLRAWIRVVLLKHLFEHRYDYRQEWLRFTDTVGRQSGASLEERAVKALADIAGAPAGLLLACDEGYRLSSSGRWNWDLAVAPVDDAEPLLRHLEKTGFILDFDAVRDGWLAHGEMRVRVPERLARIEVAWAGIPLIHGGRLAGLVILAYPAVRRKLDWEDFDLFRNAGIQAASYIAEARGQQALADAQRFDEFNRRFAFILHDIKNLVSQLSLVTRNAERHADNPEFRADMIATLQSSVKKMNDMLARLSPGAQRGAEPGRPVEIRPLIETIAEAKSRVHPVKVRGETGLMAVADASGLEQALLHLVQNAIDASPTGEPVEIRLYESGGDVAIDVADRGHGMPPAFVRDRLFQPFVSTKESGFGIGAYEARALIQSMGGRLDVESAEQVGTTFTLYLPAAGQRTAPTYERMRA